MPAAGSVSRQKGSAGVRRTGGQGVAQQEDANEPLRDNCARPKACRWAGQGVNREMAQGGKGVGGPGGKPSGTPLDGSSERFDSSPNSVQRQTF